MLSGELILTKKEILEQTTIMQYIPIENELFQKNSKFCGFFVIMSFNIADEMFNTHFTAYIRGCDHCKSRSASLFVSSDQDLYWSLFDQK
jgi:hypothetical protein